MTNKITKDLDIKTFVVFYSIISIVAYVALCHLFVRSYEFLTKPFLEDHEIPITSYGDKFPSVSAVISGLFVLIKIFLTKAFIKDKSENSQRNLTALIETDFAFLLIFLSYITFYFVDEIFLSLEYSNAGTIIAVLTATFLATLILIGIYNCLAICALKCRKEIFSEKGVFHFFINPINILVILAGLCMELGYVFAYGSYKFKVQWWEFVYALALYAISFVFLILLAKKSKITPDLSKQIFATNVSLTIISRILLVWLRIFIWKFDYIECLFVTLMMCIPLLSGAFVAKRIANKKQ